MAQTNLEDDGYQVEGYWKNNIDDNNSIYPYPFSTDDMVDKIFICKLELLTLQYASVKRYRGFSTCRLCGKMNGTNEYILDDYKYPEGLMHYYIHHNVHPSINFKNYIDEIYDEYEGDDDEIIKNLYEYLILNYEHYNKFNNVLDFSIVENINEFSHIKLIDKYFDMRYNATNQSLYKLQCREYKEREKNIQNYSVELTLSFNKIINDVQNNNIHDETQEMLYNYIRQIGDVFSNLNLSETVSSIVDNKYKSENLSIISLCDDERDARINIVHDYLETCENINEFVSANKKNMITKNLLKEHDPTSVMSMCGNKKSKIIGSLLKNKKNENQKSNENKESNRNIDTPVDYVYLDSEERRRFALVAHEYVIEQLYEQQKIKCQKVAQFLGADSLLFEHIS